MHRVVRFQEKRALAHAPDPVIGKRSRLQKSPRSFDRRERRGDRVRDREARDEWHGYSSELSFPITTHHR